MTVPEGVELTTLAAGQDPVIVAISHAKVVEEEEAVVEGEEEVPAGEVPTTAETEAPAEDKSED